MLVAGGVCIAYVVLHTHERTRGCPARFHARVSMRWVCGWTGRVMQNLRVFPKDAPREGQPGEWSRVQPPGWDEPGRPAQRLCPNRAKERLLGRWKLCPTRSVVRHGAHGKLAHILWRTMILVWHPPALLRWGEWDSNPHGQSRPAEFKSAASAIPPPPLIYAVDCTPVLYWRQLLCYGIPATGLALSPRSCYNRRP